jgi:hypothetical protein
MAICTMLSKQACTQNFSMGEGADSETIYSLRFTLKTMSTYSEVLYFIFQISNVLAISRFQWLISDER